MSTNLDTFSLASMFLVCFLRFHHILVVLVVTSFTCSYIGSSSPSTYVGLWPYCTVDEHYAPLHPLHPSPTYYVYHPRTDGVGPFFLIYWSSWRPVTTAYCVPLTIMRLSRCRVYDHKRSSRYEEIAKLHRLSRQVSIVFKSSSCS